MSFRLGHPVLIAIVTAPLALAAEPAIAAPARAGTSARPKSASSVDERGRLGRLHELVAASYDSARGGFVDKSGQPSEGAVELGLHLGRDAAAADWRRRSLTTIAWMNSLMDTVSGGYVTRRPRSPAEGAAFESRTDVNGRRLAMLVAAWRTTGDERYRKDATRVARYMDRILLDGLSSFFSTPGGTSGFPIDRFFTASAGQRVRHGETEVVGDVWAPPSSEAWLGLDNLGRDMFSRLVYGARTTITIALATTLLSFGIGCTLGFSAAATGRWLDMPREPLAGDTAAQFARVAALKAETALLPTKAVDYSVYQRGCPDIQFHGGKITELIANPPTIAFLRELFGSDVVLMSVVYARSEPGHPGISLHADGQPCGSGIVGYEGSCTWLVRVLYYLDDLTPQRSPFKACASARGPAARSPAWAALSRGGRSPAKAISRSRANGSCD